MLTNFQRSLRRRSTLLVGLWLGGIAAAGEAQTGAFAADPRSASVARCTTALDQRIRSEHPHTDRVVVLGASLVEWPAGRGSGAGVAGDGRMLRGEAWDDFEFSCWLDARGGVARVDWSGPYHDGEPVRGGHRRPRAEFEPLDPGSSSARLCLDALHGEIRSDHPSSGRLEAGRGGLERWRRPDAEVVVHGQGRFEGARGQWHPISFQCRFERDERRVTRAWYELD